jgi:hypothetical protein
MELSIRPWVIALIALGFVSASPAIAQQSIEATLVFDRTEFELGEPIVFAYGRKVPGMIDAMRLLEPLCELSVRRPDGSKLFTRESQGITVYDGPSQVSSLFRKALLNDLVRLAEGNYNVVHSCGARGVSQQIAIRAPSLLEKVSISVVFPQMLDLFGRDLVKVVVTVTNDLDRLIRIVAPSSNRSAGVVAALSVPSIPATAWLPMSSSDSAGSAVSAFLPITRSNFEKLNLVNLGPGESFTANLTFSKDSVQRFTDGDRTRADGFQLQSAAIVPILLDSPNGDQPVMRAFRQTGVCYDRSGNRNDAGCTLSSLDWSSHLHLDLPTNSTVSRVLSVHYVGRKRSGR